jgi:hypothetical protein
MFDFHSSVLGFEMKNMSKKKKRQAAAIDEPWYIIHI